MAFRGENQKKTPQWSCNLTRLWSTDKGAGSDQSEYVDISFYNYKLAFNFGRGFGKEAKTSFITLDYNQLSVLSTAIDKLIVARVDEFRKGTPYTALPEISYNLTSRDDVSGEERKTGALAVGVTANEGDRSNAYFSFTNGAQSYRIVLGPGFLPTKFTLPSNLYDIDINDHALYAFGNFLHSIVKLWPIIVMQYRAQSSLMYNVKKVGSNDMGGGSLGFSRDIGTPGSMVQDVPF